MSRPIFCKQCGKRLSDEMTVKIIRWLNKYFRGEKIIRNTQKRGLKYPSHHFYVNIIRYPETKERPFIFCCYECKLKWMNEPNENKRYI